MMATILIVDDRATNREIARMALDDSGHHVLEATEGQKGLEIARHDHPDLVLTDVVMPGIDGYEFVRRLRADTCTADIPVLMFTANYRPEEAEPLASAYGVNRVIAKSVEPDELVAAVEEALGEAPRAGWAPTGLPAEHLRTVNAKLVEKVLALGDSEARFGALADLSPVGIVSGGADLRATYVNPRLCDIAGTPAGQLHGHGWLLCLPAEDSSSLSRAGVPADRLTCYGRVSLPDGRQRWLQTTIRPIVDDDLQDAGFVATVDDVTAVVDAEQRRYADERDRQVAERRRIAERFDSLARLSGAVAHDFNNILSIILSFSEFTHDELRDAIGTTLDTDHAAPMLRDLQNVRRAGKRGAHLTHQLLTFGGREAVQPTAIEINDLVREAQGMVQSSMGQQVTVATDLDPGAGTVVADGNQLSQVLLNLAANARDAMPHGGLLTFATRRSGAEQPGGLPRGHYVHVVVRDTGEGMSPDVLDHAVEPFFTTKPNGSGSGLGLATAYGIVRQASGDLVIESTPGHGTTVNIYLPVIEAPVPALPTAVSAEPGAGQTILVVDDEDGIREVASRILTRAGYRILAAANGQEALGIALAHPEAIHAVLSDIVMPRMTGPGFVAELHQVRPEIPVLYMSGFAEPLMNDQGQLPRGVAVVGKPFTREDLLRAVQTTLTRQHDTSATAGA
jgi:PAS domain S-box-containing protein